MWQRVFLTFLIYLAAGLAGTGNAVPAPSLPVQSLDVGGQTRTYRLEPTGSVMSGQKRPVVIFLHGSRTDIREPIPARFDIPFGTVAGAEPLLVALPQGIDGRWNFNTVAPGILERVSEWVGWHRPPADDLGFLNALIDHLVRDDSADPQRVYVAGVSLGGFMAVRVACEMSDKVAAVAVVLATAHNAQLAACDGARAIPVLILASTTDPEMPYTGWWSAGPRGALSIPETVAFFVKHDGCRVRTERPLPHLDIDLPSTVSEVEYSGCSDDAEVRFYRVDGSGHSVPSRAPPEAGDWVANGARNRDIDTAEEVWDFFRAHRLPHVRGAKLAGTAP